MPSMSFISFSSKQTSPSPALETTSPVHVESSAPPATSPDSENPSTTTSSDQSDASEPQSLSQTFYPSLAALKDQRAYEHERQRSKKAADLAKAKARKGQWSLLTYDSKRVSQILSRSSSTRSWTPEKSKRLRPEEATIAEALALDGIPGVTGLVHDNAHVRGGGDDASAKPEVKLADLISSESVRKPRARRGKDSDYELIPHVRSVIVLDDITTRDVSFDEPWEHIDHSDSEDSTSSSEPGAHKKKDSPKTYASILSVGSANANTNAIATQASK
ncbi:hypothetical protein D9758_009953 [Tetrapyrgos nigripes]|uniref:Uncharacterized protein n=1 Tax=Tetrapyrgos nigripes TaxID=182062 RepID=A0A8H5CQN7_9AGAR|nr:hypothetical protein D9758_009953 [Tetrapyrgos nigripes]